MIDIHTHLVPGVDDGSWNLEMSQSMLVSELVQGAQAVFATPHSFAFKFDAALVKKFYAELCNYLRGLHITAPVYLGCEVYCEPDSMDKTLKMLKTGTYPSMNGTSYVLTEFSPRVEPQDALVMARALTKEGWNPIIAHTERCPGIFRENMIEALSDLGCLFQINAYSLEEEPEETVKTHARELVERRLAAFLGSDMHRLNHRPPSIASGLRYIRASCDEDYAEALISGNARRLLLGGSGKET